MKVFVSGYQLIDMHCIALPVKFDGGLSISFLRKKQLYKKRWAQVCIFKSSSFQNRFNPRHERFLSSRSLGYARAVFFVDRQRVSSGTLTLTRCCCYGWD
jgi:hypothetical protein